MTKEQLMEECESMEAPKGYEFAVEMAAGSMAIGDGEFAGIAAAVARELMARNLHKPARLENS